MFHSKKSQHWFILTSYFSFNISITKPWLVEQISHSINSALNLLQNNVTVHFIN